MQPPTRVFVVADNHSEARRLGKIFTESAGFLVTGFGVPATLSGLNARKVDVVVVRTEHRIHLTGSSRISLPILYLVPDTDGAHRGAKAVLPWDANPAQIRAGALAVAAGLHVGQADFKPTSCSDSEFGFLEPLTDRELRVLDLIAEGLSNPEIARHLGISRNTAKFHVSSIIAKLGATSRTEAVTVALRRGLMIL